MIYMIRMFSGSSAILSLVVLLFLTQNACTKKNPARLVSYKKLDNYPSASGAEFLNGKIYVIGDDANDLLVLDTSLKPLDTLRLYSFAEKRIPKDIKPDLESISIVNENKLLLMGSGSLDPYRNIAWIIDPVNKQRDSIRIDTIIQRMKNNFVPQLNLEGGTSIPGYVVFSSRGNKNVPKNYLLFVTNNFWTQQQDARISSLLVGSNSDAEHFSGVSGLAYSYKTDRMIIAVSTEDTRNAIDDGAIGKSYLWFIDNISSKKRWSAINPNKIIDLEKISAQFKGHKVESVAILSETNKQFHLLLTADDDNGSSSLFTIMVNKK